VKVAWHGRCTLDRVSAQRTNDQILLDDAVEAARLSVNPSADEDAFFLSYVIEQLLKDRELSFDQIEAGITDGGGDGQIDGFYTFAGTELVEDDTNFGALQGSTIDTYIIQAKTTPGFGEHPLTTIAATLSDILPLESSLPTLSGKYNEPLRRAAGLLHSAVRGMSDRIAKYRFVVAYASRADGDPHPNVEAEAQRIRQVIGSQFRPADVDLQFLGATELMTLIRRRRANVHQLRYLDSPIVSGESGYACLVGLKEFRDFLVTDEAVLNESLFDSNVRAYQGSTAVNGQIRQSLEARGPEDFWWLNNGVSIVATEVTAAGRTYSLRDPQVVNGLQTSREIFQYLSDYPGADETRSVLIRIVVPESEASRNAIIRATNSQNNVPASSLRATEKIHHDIEAYFFEHGLFYDRRKNYYKNLGKSRARIVTIPALAQAMAAIVVQRPSTARARPGSLATDDALYGQVFDESTPLPAYFAVARLMAKVESQLRAGPAEVALAERLDMKFHVATVVGAMITRSTNPTPVQLIAIDIDAIDDATITTAYNLVSTLANARVDLATGSDMDKVTKSTELQTEVLAALPAILPT
jgi:hypothetical protein